MAFRESYILAQVGCMVQERKQLDRRWLWLGAVVILIIVFFSARSLLRERLPVRVVQVGREVLTKTTATNGRVEPESKFEYHSPIATTVKAVFVQAGDKVPAGKLLMELDDSQIRARLASAESGVKTAQAAVEAATHNGTQVERQAAAADVAKARLDHDQAQRDLDSLTKLNQTGAASASEVAAARERLSEAQAVLEASNQSATSRYSAAEVARAEAALRDAESNLEAAQKTESQMSYRSPVAGTVYQVDVAATEFVEEGKELLELADLKHVQIRAYFDEPEIGLLAVGQNILIRWDAKPGKEWHGHITRTPSTVTTYNGTRNVGEAMVAIDDPDGTLLPETHVTVTVTTSSAPNSLNVPREAIHSEGGKYYVYKVVDGNLERVQVTIGTYNTTQMAILSGVNEGDWVATGTTNGLPLQLGVPITVVHP
jgi:HlyD family secretion protein